MSQSVKDGVSSAGRYQGWNGGKWENSGDNNSRYGWRDQRTVS